MAKATGGDLMTPPGERVVTNTLGRTGLVVGRLGVACSYGAPQAAFEEAFDRGVNYFYWGSRRTAAMARAIRHLVSRGHRERLVIVLQSYSRSPRLLERFLHRGLRRLGLDAADVLLLGWHNRPPAPRLVDQALALKARGRFRFLALSGHHRPLFAALAQGSPFDIFHVRYNAAHRGAETEVFPKLPRLQPPGVVTYTATRWGALLDPRRMPAGEAPLRGADCYRFALSHPAVHVCMTGPRSREELQEALLALDLGPLSDSEMERVRRLGDHLHRTRRRLWFN
jgi:aryl-alcohol dehydrogenase-like predicted oxidoreductase